MTKIWKLENKKEAKLLRKKLREFDFDKYSKKEVDDLVKKMRQAMHDANGIGLAANQIGLDMRVFVAQWEGKFYAFFNPVIEESSKDTWVLDQSCLSLPGKWGEVERPDKITLVAQNKQGKKVKVKAWGMLSQIFQHEVDHLNGKLFIDRMKKGALLREVTKESKYEYVFFGSPEIAGKMLKRLVQAGAAPKALICNPDRPVGRKKVITPPFTKQLVLENDWPIDIYQPETKEELVEVSKKLFKDLDFGVVAAYAKILPSLVIESAKHGIVGIHPSLLPLHRGPSPIRSSILAGDKETGSTLFFVNEKMDEGPIISQDKIKIGDFDNQALSNELANLSVNMLIDILPKIASGNVKSKEQDHKKATYTNFFKTEDGYVEYEDLQQAMKGDKKLALKIDQMVRALGEEPGVYTLMDGKRTKLLEVNLEKDKLVLKTIQKEGKNPISIQT